MASSLRSSQKMKWFAALAIFVAIGFAFAFGVENNEMIQKAEIYYYSPLQSSNENSPLKIGELKNEFNPNKELKLIVHGYMANRDHMSIAPIKNAYLTTSNDGVFVADWSDASIIQYWISRYFVEPVGIVLAEKLELFLRKKRISPGHVHIVGHSLGAHIAGNIGRYFKGKIGRISGLDPASPLFNGASSDDLRSDDAVFVDVIHTGAQVLGDFGPRGDADFYPNFGFVPQPGCAPLDYVTFGACSHYRAPMFFAESIRIPNSFPAILCSRNDISNQKIGHTLNFTGGDTVFMGESVSTNARGTYYLETNYIPPFGRGFLNEIPTDDRVYNV